MQLFEWVTGNQESGRFSTGDARDGSVSVLEGLDQRPGSFTDTFSALVPKGTNDQVGIENIQSLYSILNSILLGESVYLPLLHTLAPSCYQGRDVMSEVWAGPDVEDQKENGRRIEMPFKLYIREPGRFDAVLALQDRWAEM